MSKAIILVAFGSAHLDGIKNSILLLEEEYKNRFNNEYLVITAFTSKRVIQLLKERYNVYIPHLTEVLFKLANNGYDDVIVQPLHMISGRGYEEVKKTIDEYRYSFKTLVLKQGLLFSDKDISKLVNELADSIKKGPILLAGHGSKSDSNEVYYKIQSILDSKLDSRVYLATIDGEATIEDAIKEMHKDRISEVTIEFLFIIPGKHIVDDICYGNSSWKAAIERAGIKVNLSKTSLLQQMGIRKIFTDKLD